MVSFPTIQFLQQCRYVHHVGTTTFNVGHTSILATVPQIEHRQSCDPAGVRDALEWCVGVCLQSFFHGQFSPLISISWWYLLSGVILPVKSAAHVAFLRGNPPGVSSPSLFASLSGAATWVGVFGRRFEILPFPASAGFFPMRNGYKVQSTQEHSRISLACPPQQSRHLNRIAFSGVMSLPPCQ